MAKTILQYRNYVKYFLNFMEENLFDSSLLATFSKERESGAKILVAFLQFLHRKECEVDAMCVCVFLHVVRSTG